jgi:hypothetical protein
MLCGLNANSLLWSDGPRHSDGMGPGPVHLREAPARQYGRTPGSPEAELASHLPFALVGHQWPQRRAIGGQARFLGLEARHCLATAGRTLASVEQVQRYVWCGPACIVYLTGRYEESHVGFRPESMGALNVVTGEKTALPAPPYPIGITWATFDGAAYVKNRPREGEPTIYRLDLPTKTLTATVFRDHLFSPTGRYYLHRPEFTDTLVLYDTRTNAPVDISRLRRDAIPLGWASSEEDILLAVRRETAPTANKGRPVRPTPRKSGDKPVARTYELYPVPDGRSL